MFKERVETLLNDALEEDTSLFLIDFSISTDNKINVVLDGDNVRHGLCSDLSFNETDRNENMRRVGEVAKLFNEAGTIVIAAFISPYREDREKVRSRLPHGDFLEVYCECDLKTCETRDPKGLYARARKGEIENFTGISAPYEEPIKPDIIVNTNKQTLDEEVEIIINTLIIMTIYLKTLAHIT